MPQELNIEELRRIAELHNGMTPESWLMDWAAGEIERLNMELQQRDKCSFMGPMRDCPTHGESANLTALRQAMKDIADGNCRETLKAEKCEHGRYGFEDCENCISEFAAKALGSNVI